MTPKLTARQKAFIFEYPKDKNGTQAAIRAGYSPKAAKETGSKLLTNRHIRDAIDSILVEQQNKCIIDAAFILNGLKQLAIQCADQTKDTYNPTAANKSYELLGKNLQLFSDKVIIEGDLKISITPPLFEDDDDE